MEVRKVVAGLAVYTSELLREIIDEEISLVVTPGSCIARHFAPKHRNATFVVRFSGGEVMEYSTGCGASEVLQQECRQILPQRFASNQRFSGHGNVEIACVMTGDLIVACAGYQPELAKLLATAVLHKYMAIARLKPMTRERCLAAAR